MSSLSGKVAIVTGGGRGIGAAACEYLAAKGAIVVVNDIGAALDGSATREDPAAGVVAKSLAVGGQAIRATVNVTDADAARALVNDTIRDHGRLDILVNAAGIIRDRMIFNMSIEEWRAVLAVHLDGHFNMIRPAAAHWRQLKNPDGQYRIINFTSRAGIHGAPGQPNYSAAKAGIIGLTYACAISLNRYGVTTNALAPAASTRMTDSAAEATQSAVSAPEAPEDVATTIGWLASEESQWCNGRVLYARGNNVAIYNDPIPLAEVDVSSIKEGMSLDDALRAAWLPIIEQAPQNPFVTA